jgi:hypothetical protein
MSVRPVSSIDRVEAVHLIVAMFKVTIREGKVKPASSEMWIPTGRRPLGQA